MSAPDRKKRILYFTPHRFGRSGGQRFRCEQYIPFLEQAGFEWEYAPLLVSEKEDDDFYQPGNYVNKFLLLLRTFKRRLNDVKRAKQFDIAFIYREAFMTGTTFFERQLKQNGIKIIYDLDDAIWNFDVSEGNKNLGWLKRPEKVKELMRLADRIIAGSNYLAHFARSFNSSVCVIPSTLDLTQYTFQPKTTPSDAPVIIGWSGSVTTLKHFKTIIPVYKELKRKYGQQIAFRLYGLPGYTNTELDITSIDFSPATEVPTIASFDIGVMPLPDDEWTRGKCGMKGLQYMALGVPAVMQAVGANLDIIRDGENGFLANSEREWITKLSSLIESKALRQRLAKEGRKTIEQAYSLQATKDAYVALFRELVEDE